MKNSKITTVLFVFIIILSQMNCFAKNNVTAGNVYEIVEVGKSKTGKMIDFFFIDDNGKKTSIKSLVKNKFVFLNFWATWCPPCRAEIPDIIEIQKDLQNKDLIVLGIALEREKTLDKEKAKVKKFATSKRMNYINFVTTQKIKKALTEAYGGIPYIPTTFLIDKKQNVFEKIQGGRKKQEFLKSLNKMIK